MTFSDYLTKKPSSISKASLGQICSSPRRLGDITMKKIVIDNYIPFLCDDIIINILKRLPSKSLIRFQCVCKHWKNLINDPSFITDHLHHSTLQNPCLLFQPYDRKGPLHLLDCEMQVRRVPNHPLIDYLKCGCVVGSSNGLLCVEISKDGISHHSLLLCNPAIRDVRQVSTTYADFYGSLGFGFSPIVSDYKIVKFYANMMFDDLVEKVEVYSLRTGSWKGVELGILDGVCISSTSLAANGAIFWFGFKLEEDDEIGYHVGGNGYEVIISFDIAMEVFTLIPMPAIDPRLHLNRLTVYENKLAMLAGSWVENSESFLIDLWVMEEGAVASRERWSWTKKYISTPYPHFLNPMTIWRNEIVCSISTGRKSKNDEPNTVLVNLSTEEFTKFAVSRSRYGHHIFNYVESLIPVGEKKLSAMFV